MYTQENCGGLWIPDEILKDGRLSALEKIILTEIGFLDNGEDGCWASNAHIAERCGCSEKYIRQTVAKLTELGFLTILTFDGRRRRMRCNMEQSSVNAGTKAEAERNNVPYKPEQSSGKTGTEFQKDRNKVPGRPEQSSMQTGTECRADRNKVPPRIKERKRESKKESTENARGGARETELGKEEKGGYSVPARPPERPRGRKKDELFGEAEYDTDEMFYGALERTWHEMLREIGAEDEDPPNYRELIP